MLECAHCGALASVASEICPTCGKPFDVHSHDPVGGNADGESAEQSSEVVHVQNTDLLDDGDASPSSPAPIPIRHVILHSVNLVLLALFIILLIHMPSQRAANERVGSTPTATATRVATESTSVATPTLGASPAPTSSSVGAPATATHVPRPSATATPVATEMPPPPPTVQPPAPSPTPTP